VSDHGESLGENNLYMHGVPMSLAPREQLEIPFIVWLSSNDHTLKNLPEVGQYHVFHSILDFFGMKSPVFDETKNIFE
jgi:lipid A ethanolaminephosphotransferase